MAPFTVYNRDGNRVVIPAGPVHLVAERVRVLPQPERAR